MRKVVAIVQARMGSTRLPGKVMKNIHGKPMLQWVIERTKQARSLNKIIIATTRREEDKLILKFSRDINIDAFAGSEIDVLDRYYKAAKKYKADIVVRITADCPLIDPEIIDKVVNKLHKNFEIMDYVATDDNSFPDGVDTMAVKLSALEKAWREAKTFADREHVMPYIWRTRPDLFKTYFIKNEHDWHEFRWTVDETEDLELVSNIMEEADKKGIKKLYTSEIFEIVNKHPEWREINRRFKRNEGLEKSLEKEVAYKKPNL